MSVKLLALLAAFVGGFAAPCFAQNYERYHPKTIPLPPPPKTVTKGDLPVVEGSDRVLVDALDAVIVLDHQDKIDPDNAFADASGISYDFDTPNSLVYSDGFRSIVEGYLDGPISLRRLSEMSRDLTRYYQKRGQPVVDVIIPEQRITAGTVQIVVVESRIGRVLIEDGCYFDACDLTKWVCCTQRGSRIYESSIANDMFWLNQNAFRQVDVDLRPGDIEGTTDVVFEINDVQPWNSYAGYEDTGVRSLMLERLYGGVIWGNAFGRGGSLSYQYTADADFRHLHAHAVSYLEPMSRDWSFQTYASWAAVDPKLGIGLNQEGESWQAGIGMIRHLTKNQYVDESLSFGFDFKSTNNNLEFGGINVSGSNADLAQLRAGYRKVERYCCDEYSIMSLDAFVGPGNKFSSNATTAAFNTIRTGTSPDYIYLRGKLERMWNLPSGWELMARARGQAASERLLFSETLGFGGYDSIRGYDQRAFSGDHGWITNVELGPKTRRYCRRGKKRSLRFYGLFDAGQAFVQNPVGVEPNDEFLVSLGLGMRWTLGDRTSLRIDYAHGFEDSVFFQNEDRIHIGLVSLFGPRP